MTGPLALSVDELRALARLTGLLLPSLLLDDDDLDAGVRDAVAVRGLLARGLLRFDEVGDVAGDRADRPAAIALTARLATLLAPLTDPDTVAELEVEVGDRVLHTAVAGHSAGLLLLSEREPDVWVLTGSCSSLAEVLQPLLDDAAGGDGGTLAVGRRTGTSYVLEQVDWSAGDDAAAAALPLLAVAA